MQTFQYYKLNSIIVVGTKRANKNSQGGFLNLWWHYLLSQQANYHKQIMIDFKFCYGFSYRFSAFSTPTNMLHQKFIILLDIFRSPASMSLLPDYNASSSLLSQNPIDRLKSDWVGTYKWIKQIGKYCTKIFERTCSCTLWLDTEISPRQLTHI